MAINPNYMLVDSINKTIDLLKSGKRPSASIEFSNQTSTDFSEDEIFWLTLTSLDWGK